MFTTEVAEQLKFYVYRLIDPRNGETFYVGKGTGNRVFAHIRDELDAAEDIDNQKLRRIREIRRDDFEVAHVIHRHGLDEPTAFEVEAALIDAYPEAINIAGGRASDDRGVMHSKQIIERYQAQPAVFRHKAVIITINRSAEERGIYEAVRYAWKLDPAKAAQVEIVLAVIQGLIVGVFVADRWIAATMQNFPDKPEYRPGRWAFEGKPAPDDVAKLYLRHRLPEHMRKRGAANPIRYVLHVDDSKDH
jgi:uncharacterized protein